MSKSAFRATPVFVTVPPSGRGQALLFGTKSPPLPRRVRPHDLSPADKSCSPWVPRPSRCQFAQPANSDSLSDKRKERPHAILNVSHRKIEAIRSKEATL